MANLKGWDKEYQEIVMEYLYGLTHDELIEALLHYLDNSDVDDLIDHIQEQTGEKWV
jgi:hypothetical protein